MINPYKRYQVGLPMRFLYPERIDGKCACGCNKILDGRKRRWYSKECQKTALNNFYIIKGDTKVIRETLFRRDQGYCKGCGVYSDTWQADHIIPVHQGGGACTLDNFQTLCEDCHKDKTFNLNPIPHSCNIHAASLNLIPSVLDTFGAFNQRICRDIKGKAVIVFD